MRKYVEHVQLQCENDRNAASMTGAQWARDASFSQAALPHVGGGVLNTARLLAEPTVIDVRQPRPFSALVIGTLTNPLHCLGVCARWQTDETVLNRLSLRFQRLCHIARGN